jgi:hypothetical protein
MVIETFRGAALKSGLETRAWQSPGVFDGLGVQPVDQLLMLGLKISERTGELARRGSRAGCDGTIFWVSFFRMLQGWIWGLFWNGILLSRILTHCRGTLIRPSCILKHTPDGGGEERNSDSFDDELAVS